MDTLEQITFLTSIHPFDTLSRVELNDLANSLDIVYFKKDELLQKETEEPKNLYFILKGLVQEKQDDEVLSVYSTNEFFDPVSLIENYSKHSFVTEQETICYSLPREIFIKILRQNSKLESYFFQSISQKLNANINNEKNKDLANIMIAKVKDANVHRAVIVPFETSIYDAVTTIKKEKVPTLLLKDDNDDMFIVTDSDFREKVILNRMNFDESVGKISNSGLLYINENDFLFNAQLTMTKHGLKRLVVKNDEEEIVGIIDQMSLSSFFATHTFSVSNTIEKAETIEELKEASLSFTKIITSLNAKGVKIEFISKLINQLNRKVMHKLFVLLSPKELIGHYCLVVMGSEGRGEQVLKTDQDNALIIADDCTLDDKTIQEFAHNYTEHLVDFGFPRCEGNIMVSNPYWCRRQKDFKDLIYTWITKPSGDNFMNLAIFYDAAAASGNRAYIDELKQYIFKIGSTSQTFYMHFAKIIMDFKVPLGFFDGFVYDNKEEHKDEIDIKKGGIFILVQSIRALSLEHKVMRLNTVKRILELNEIGELEDEFTQELIEAFNFLHTLKLKSNLEKLDAKQTIDNYINPKNMNTMEKDLLKESFKIINKLKKKLEHHYKLNYV